MANPFTSIIKQAAATTVPEAAVVPVVVTKPSIVVPGRVSVPSPAQVQPAMAPVALPPSQPTGAITAEQYQYKSQPDIMGPEDEQQFKLNLELLRNGFPHKEMIAPVLRRILVDLDNHPEWRNWLAPKDLGDMLRTLKQSYGVMVQIAQGKKKKKKEAAELPAGANMDEMLAMLKGTLV